MLQASPSRCVLQHLLYSPVTFSLLLSFFILLSGKVYFRLTACLLAALLIFTFNPLKHPLVTPVHFSDKERLGELVWVKEGKYGIVSVIDYENRLRSLW